MENRRKSVPGAPFDPNRNQNRIPSQTELATLRNIRTQKRQMSDTTQRQLQAALKEHKHIQARHDQLLRDLEAAQSELSISYSYLEILTTQLELFQAEDNTLAGLLHPIRRCPQDLLNLIFEWTVEMDDRRRLTVANMLSQVCKSWRAAALNLLRLWSDIQISMHDGIDALKLFMERTRLRLRNFPPEIKLENIGECSPEEMETAMNHIQLAQFRSINRLEYHLSKRDDLHNIHDPHFLFAPVSVKNFTLKACSVSELWMHGNVKWDCAWIIQQSSDLQSLELEVLTTVNFDEVAIAPSLHKLVIRNSPVPSLLQEIGKFPGLKELEIAGRTFKMRPIDEEITLAHLHILRICHVKEFTWSKISAPHLRELAMDISDNETPVITQFCARHPSIINLRHLGWLEEDELQALATALPNLESFDTLGELQGMYTANETSTPLFPKLKELTVDHSGDNSLSLIHFEHFVRARLLPQHSDDFSNLKKWSILVDYPYLEIEPWRKSDLFCHLRESYAPSRVVKSQHYVVLEPK